jgi:hypothetical protein
MLQLGSIRKLLWRPLAAEAARVGVLLLAVSLAVVGWRRLDARWSNYDTALRWYGASIFLLIVAAVPLPTPARAKALWSRAASFCLRHRWEILAFGAVFSLAVFMRVHQFGHFPPSDGVAYEEAQTGGAGYSILNHGDRPVEFAVTDYTAALGLALFGYDITGLRLPFLLISILGVAALYLLLRLMVGAPAALFATALFAVNRWHASTSGIADETFLGSGVAIIAALLLVVVLRTGNPVALIGLGLVTAGLACEYTAYRHVPFLILAALVLAVALRVGKEVWLRRRRLVTVAAMVRGTWRLPVMFAIALAVAASPLVISSLHGSGVFTEAFGRHEAAHARTAFFGLLPPDWPTRLKWLTEVFLPLGPREYPDLAPVNLPGERMLDPVTASLALIAMAYAILTIHRPYRSFFAAWLFIGLFVGATIPVEFYVSKFTGLLPPLFVLIAFLVHDAIRAVPARIPKAATFVALVPLVVWASVVNVQVFHEQGNNKGVRREFNSPLVNLCNFARGLGPDMYVYMWSEVSSTEQLFGHSDFDWVCSDIKGQSLSSLLEVSPLEPRPYSNVAFVYQSVAPLSPDPTSALAQAYPTVDGPTLMRRPFDSYDLRAFVLPWADVAERQGLQAAYYGDAQTTTAPIASRLDPASLFADGEEIDWPTGSARVHWEGLVLTKDGGLLALVPEAKAPLRVSVDGQVVYESDGVGERTTPVDLRPGWHVLQLDLDRTEVSRAPRLSWVAEAPRQSALVEEADLFALSPLQGWTHIRSLEVAGVAREWQRIDPQPAFGWSEVWLPDSLAISDAPRWPPVGHLLNEEWKSNVSVPATDTYTAKLDIRSGTAVLLVDGAPAPHVVPGSGSEATEEIELHLEQGQHRVELTFVNSGSGLVGVTLAIGGAGTEIVHFTPS